MALSGSGARWRQQAWRRNAGGRFRRPFAQIRALQDGHDEAPPTVASARTEVVGIDGGNDVQRRQRWALGQDGSTARHRPRQGARRHPWDAMSMNRCLPGLGVDGIDETDTATAAWPRQVHGERDLCARVLWLIRKLKTKGER